MVLSLSFPNLRKTLLDFLELVAFYGFSRPFANANFYVPSSSGSNHVADRSMSSTGLTKFRTHGPTSDSTPPSHRRLLLMMESLPLLLFLRGDAVFRPAFARNHL